MAGTDVRLDEGPAQNWVVLDAPAVLSTGSDLMLDSAHRRKPNGSLYRRALVHDAGDGLTINFAGDYQGGVTLNGVRDIYPKPADEGEVQLRRRQESDIVVHGGIVYHTSGLGADLQLHVTEHDLATEIADLQRQVQALIARVAALEAR